MCACSAASTTSGAVGARVIIAVVAQTAAALGREMPRLVRMGNSVAMRKAPSAVAEEMANESRLPMKKPPIISTYGERM